MSTITMKNNRSAFTLIEIMIVVCIIGILCMIAVPSWMGARERTYTKNCVAQLSHIRDAKDQWAIENKMGDNNSPTWPQLLVYIKQQPSCPAGGNYTIGTVSTDPSCSFGQDHILN